MTSVQPASAAGIVGTGTPASCTEAALNRALAGGGNVYFNCGVSPHTIPITREKVVANNTLIDGMTNGQSLITLSGRGQNRIFLTQDGVEFTVKNLTIVDGFTTEQGGAISSGSQGKLRVVKCDYCQQHGK